MDIMIKKGLTPWQITLFAIQMVLSVFVATVLIATICGVAVSGALVGAGVATLAYAIVTKGKSPMFVSNSGAFVAPVMIALGLGGYSAVAIGGLTSCVVYCLFGFIFSKISVESIYKVFPPALIGTITVVIGINLMPFILNYVQINEKNSQVGVLIAMITMISIALFSHYGKGLISILPFLLGTLVGYGVALALTITGVYPVIDLSVFENLKLFAVPDFAFTHFDFHSITFAIIIPVVLLYVAYTVSAMMECLSDHAALGNIIGTDLYRQPGLGRILPGEGVANLVGSCLGGLGICSYGEGVACIGFSGVADVRVTALAAVFLASLGFIQPVQAFIISIPNCVFAGAAIILYGFIACSGIKMLQKTNLNNQKDLIIVSSVLSIGISGIAIGSKTIALSATALALVVGIVLNLLLKNKK